MALSYFDDKTHQPDDDNLATALGRSQRHWDAFIEQSPVYGEGRGFRLPTRTKGDLESIKTLAAIKMAH